MATASRAAVGTTTTSQAPTYDWSRFPALGTSTANFANIGNTASGADVTETKVANAGADAVFTVYNNNGVYSATVTTPGAQYANGDTLVIKGTILGGATTANDFTITITASEDGDGTVEEGEFSVSGVAVTSTATAGGFTGTGSVLEVSKNRIGGSALNAAGYPNPYYQNPFSIATLANRGDGTAAGSYNFLPNNEGTYTLSLAMMNHCGAGKDSILVAARCFPIEAKPVFLLPQDETYGDAGRGGAKTGGAKRGRDIDIGFTASTKNLVVQTTDAGSAVNVGDDSSKQTGKGQWQDATDFVTGSSSYRPTGQYMVGFNANSLDTTLATAYTTAIANTRLDSLTGGVAGVADVTDADFASQVNPDHMWLMGRPRGLSLASISTRPTPPLPTLALSLRTGMACSRRRPGLASRRCQTRSSATTRRRSPAEQGTPPPELRMSFASSA
jgi:hypothetical protein